MATRPALRSALLQLHRQAPRAARRFQVHTRSLSSQVRHRVAPITTTYSFRSRELHATTSARIDILEDADKPPGEVKESEDHDLQHNAAPLSEEEYHLLSNKFLEELVEKLEVMHEEKGNMDVDYSAGVLSIVTPSAGTYILNKQPPNKQIWLSSPISGPKRFDWVVSGDSMHQKEGASVEGWVYTRDGTSLPELLRKELGVQVGNDPYETEIV